MLSYVCCKRFCKTMYLHVHMYEMTMYVCKCLCVSGRWGYEHILYCTYDAEQVWYVYEWIVMYL